MNYYTYGNIKRYAKQACDEWLDEYEADYNLGREQAFTWEVPDVMFEMLDEVAWNIYMDMDDDEIIEIVGENLDEYVYALDHSHYHFYPMVNGIKMDLSTLYYNSITDTNIVFDIANEILACIVADAVADFIHDTCLDLHIENYMASFGRFI